MDSREEQLEFAKIFTLFTTRKEVVAHNERILQLRFLSDNALHVYRINAKHGGPDSVSKLDSKDAKGLHGIVSLQIGAPIMVLANICQKFGLCNGTTGTVVDVVYTENDQAMPHFVVCDIPDYTGEPFMKGEGQSKWVPIAPVSRKFQFGKEKINGSRKQLPLQLAWGVTVHKAQGITLEKVRVLI